jgi:hypothetical protein
MLELMSPSIGAVASALSKAQAAFKPAIKDAANPFFKSKYVDLAGAIDASREALAANGLAVIQTTEVLDNGTTVLRTTLAHSSGEWIASVYPVVPVKADPQGMGSALTYARRYCLMAIIGLAAEDDDGNQASQPVQQSKWTEGQKTKANNLRRKIAEAGGGDELNQLWSTMDKTEPDIVLSGLEILASKFNGKVKA